MFDYLKDFFTSKTVLMCIVTLGASVVGFFGYAVSAEDQENLVALIMTIVTGAGSVGAIVSRVIAKKKIGGGDLEEPHEPETPAES